MDGKVQTIDDKFWNVLTSTRIKGKDINDKYINCKISSKNKSYYLHEVLTSNTFSKWIPEIEWEVNQCSVDGGLDFKGVRKESYFDRLELGIKESYLGEVKAKKNFLTGDLDDVFGKLTRKANSDSAFAIFLILYRQTVEKINKLQKTLDSSDYNIYYSPKYIAGEETFINDWVIDKEKIQKMFPNLDDEDKNIIKLYLDNYKIKYEPNISIDISDFEKNKLIYTGTTINNIIKINHNFSLNSGKVIIKLIPNKEFDILRPSSIVSDSGIEVELKNNNEFKLPILLRSYKVKKHNSYGKILILKDGNTLVEQDLPMVTVEENFMPKFFNTPLKNEILTSSKKIKQCFSKKESSLILVTGVGGIGKSRFCEYLIDYASGLGSEWMQLAHPKNIIEKNAILKNLIVNLLPNYDNLNIFNSDNIIKNLKKSISNWDDNYSRAVNNIFEDNKKEKINLKIISNVLIGLLFKKLRQTSFILHVSDLHWADEQTLTVLKYVYEGLKIIEKDIENGIFFILEGRENEVLKVNNKFNTKDLLLPKNWIEFKNNNYELIEIKNWEDKYSKEFIEDIICIDNKKLKKLNIDYDGPYIEKLIKLIMDKSKGNPMHILEQMKFLYENDYIKSTGDGQWYVIKHIEKNLDIPVEIEELIKLRIDYLSINYTKTVELISLIATIGISIPQVLYDRLVENIDEIELNQLNQTGIVSIDKGKLTFNHENYFRTLSKYKINKKSILLNIAIDWFNNIKNRSISEQLSLVKLLAVNTKNKKVFLDESFLGYKNSTNSSKDVEKSEFIKYLLMFPDSMLLEYKLNKLNLEFQYGECLGRFSSWESTAEYMVDLAEKCEEEGESNDLTQLYALAEASNKIISLQRPDDAERLIKKGLMISNLYLQDKNLTHNQKFLYQKLYDRFLHRMAVMLWFDGQVTQAVAFQRKAYSSIRKNKKENIEEWCAINRELGATLQHRSTKTAFKLFEKSLVIFDENEKEIHPLQQLLTKSEYLIAQLIKEGFSKNKKRIEQIANEAEINYHKSLKQNTLTEAVFSALIVGAAYAYLDKNELAFIWFRDATTASLECQREDEIWKARINLAQIYQILGDKQNAKLQAQLASKLIIKGLEHNPERRGNRRKLLTLPLVHIYKLKGITSQILKKYIDKQEYLKIEKWEERPIVYSKTKESQQILHIRKEHNDYFLLA